MDSNHRVTESKSVALPLGYTPIYCLNIIAESEEKCKGFGQFFANRKKITKLLYESNGICYNVARNITEMESKI